MRKSERLREELALGVKVAELEEQLAELKANPGNGVELRRVKHELREWRCVLRLGKPLDAQVVDAATGEPVRDRKGQLVTKRVHNGFNIVDGELVEKRK